MNDMKERVSLQLAFERWATPQDMDLTTTDCGFTYSNPRTADAWRGYFGAYTTLGLRTIRQQLYAEIKKSSQYASQIALCRNSHWGYPFKVHIETDRCGFVVKGGVGGQYRIIDVNLYVIEDGQKIRLH